MSFNTPSGAISSRKATITVSTVSLVLLGHKLPVLRDRTVLSYGALVAQSQQEVNLLTLAAPLMLDRMRRQLCVGEGRIALSGLEFALYVFVAEKRTQSACALTCPGCAECTVQVRDFLDLNTIARLEQIAAEGGARDPRLRQLRWWAKEGEEGKQRFLQGVPASNKRCVPYLVTPANCTSLLQ